MTFSASWSVKRSNSSSPYTYKWNRPHSQIKARASFSVWLYLPSNLPRVRLAKHTALLSPSGQLDWHQQLSVWASLSKDAKTGVLAIACFSFWKEFSCSSFHSFVLKWDPMGHCLQNSMMWMIFGATGKAFSSKLLIIMLQSNRWTLKAITCRWSTLLFKSKCASGIFCIRNSAEFLRMKTRIPTDVSETRSKLWKVSQLKISVLMQRLFLLNARLVYSGKTETTRTK